MNRLSLRDAIKRLQAEYGKPKSPEMTDPWLMILWENVAYLADDERRQSAFRELEQSVGTRPDKILAATKNQLAKITSHGILAAKFAEKLQRCADRPR